jgi:hypothetical protein
MINEWPGLGGWCVKCVREHWYTVSKQRGLHVRGPVSSRRPLQQLGFDGLGL